MAEPAMPAGGARFRVPGLIAWILGEPRRSCESLLIIRDWALPGSIV